MATETKPQTLGENYREYRTRDAEKAEWDRGEWTNEPDKAQWIDAETGLDCLIVRNLLGALCGYVGVPSSHPWHGKSYDDCDVRVHGGLTFADFCHEPTRKDFATMRERMPQWEAEAVRFPMGDASRRVRTYRPLVNDYDAWAAHTQATAICHIPATGREDRVWWLGFDCAHSGDLCPSIDRSRYGRDWNDTYKSFSYVVHQVQKLARQLRARGADPGGSGT